MEEFGIRFSVTNQTQFASLVVLFDRLKLDKVAGVEGTPEAWSALVPEDVRRHFGVPNDEARQRRIADRPPIIIREPSEQLGATWDFYRVFESIEEGDYDLLACEMVAPNTAEIHINPHGYPYGGVGPFIALAESYGFHILGVNEYGKYQSREELLGAVARHG
jgi:hypothetical protein